MQTADPAVHLSHINGRSHPQRDLSPRPMLEIPVNAKTLAARLGRSPGYVAAMKAAGYQFTHGTRTLVSDALNWLAEHREFRTTGYRRNAPGFVKRPKSAR